ncbi:hypothetical protein [Streptomyces sp. NPDC047108]|uniref:hypothetical protein n=1 Tax=Streptomyces sp. NPDC047108 TaxID=3155025 RepID=UPI0033FC6EB2
MRDTPQAAYATDGSDFRGAVKHRYGIAVRRFLAFFPAFLVMWVQLFVWQIDSLLPLAILGFIGGIWTLMLFWGRMGRVRRCSRVLRTYPLALRAPVERVGEEGSLTVFLRLGAQDGGSSTMRAQDTVGSKRRPVDVTSGLWFAGDDPFGGAAIVPGSGELLFLQPKDWAVRAGERSNAGEERLCAARRAGITRPARFR